MSGALDRFVASIRSFLTGPENEADPLHRMYDLEEEEEEESEAITVSEGAAVVVEKPAEAGTFPFFGFRTLGALKGIAPKNRELLETAGLNDIYKSAEHDTDDLMIKVAEANWNSRIVKQAPPHSNILNGQESPKNMLQKLDNPSSVPGLLSVGLAGTVKS